MRAPRLVHRSTDGLSPEAVRVMGNGFSAGKTYSAIAKDLKVIGEPVAERTIARRAAEFRSEQRRAAALRELSDLPVVTRGADELLALMEGLDVSPGYWLRYSRGVRAAVNAFLRSPSPDRARRACGLIAQATAAVKVACAGSADRVSGGGRAH